MLVFTGCGHISTYQSPKILNQGEKLWGTGISINTNKEFINDFPPHFFQTTPYMLVMDFLIGLKVGSNYLLVYLCY